MVLQQLFSEKNIFFDLESTDKDELFEEMVQHIVTLYPDVNRSQALNALIKREESMSTGVIPSIAVPHGVIENFPRTIAAVGFSKKGIDYGALDHKPVHFVFLFLFSDIHNDIHLKSLKELAFLLQNKDFLESLKSVSSPQGFISLIKKNDV